VIVRVEQALPAVTIPLIRKVLRPHQEWTEVARIGAAPGAVGLAAYLDDRVVGTAILSPEPLPDEPERPGAWRLRGMATEPELRGQGVGTRVLRTAVDLVASSGGTLIWCNARVSALGFYERGGFSIIGDRWDEPGLGPHVRMSRPVDPP
jgi:GNAT superfamily N-acetyltransferase